MGGQKETSHQQSKKPLPTNSKGFLREREHQSEEKRGIGDGDLQGEIVLPEFRGGDPTWASCYSSLFLMS